MRADDWNEWERRAGQSPQARRWHRASIVALCVALAGGAMLAAALFFQWAALLLLPGVAFVVLGLLALPVTVFGTSRASGRSMAGASGDASRLTLKTLRDIICGL